MAVTLNTIPSQTDEVARALITAGQGGDNTQNRFWWSRRGGDTIGQADISGQTDASTIPVNGSDINRILWRSDGFLRILFVADIASLVASGGGAGWEELYLRLHRWRRRRCRAGRR